jgi:polyisoprenoid-binding protein YceI
MTRTMFAAGMILAAASFAVPAMAQQEAPAAAAEQQPRQIEAGTYQADSAHTQVLFSVNHFGFNVYNGLIGGATGTLTIDPNEPEKAVVQIEIPLSGIVTTSDELTAHLKRDDFFDAEKFPTATFKSTKVEVDGDDAQITGDLTMHGVTRSVTIDAGITGSGDNPMNKAKTIGFEGGTMIKRSDFGISAYIPNVADEVYLDITAAFEKK